MVKRKDIFVIAGLLLIALVAYGGMTLARRGQSAGDGDGLIRPVTT